MIKRTLCALLAALLLLAPCAAFAQAGEGDTAAAQPPADETGEENADAALSPEEALTAKGYVLVSTATGSGWLPLPDEEDYVVPLRQILPDGTQAENLIHLTPEGVYMEDSTCENHDCVDEGMVTLDNRYERILGNMIICLPNQVFLELYSREDVLEMIRQSEASAPPEAEAETEAEEKTE